MTILVIDVGGHHVKVLASRRRRPVKLDSGPSLTAAEMVREVRRVIAHWRFDVVSIGFPGPVAANRPTAEPLNLGSGWVDFDFADAFGHPVKLVNDAAMQALGSYRGGRMLFLGLGTGLGTAMVANGTLVPMELAHLPYKKGRTYEYYAGAAGLKKHGRKHWRRDVLDIVARFTRALEADDVVVGGGNVKLFKRLPRGVRRGSNAHAFVGGYRLWS
jgi:polyphosphate glucokinase